jgi:hypothetical protein
VQRSPSACSAPRSARATLLDPYRDHLRKRRAEDPAVPVRRLLREITDSATRAAGHRSAISAPPAPATSAISVRPAQLIGGAEAQGQQRIIDRLESGYCQILAALEWALRDDAADPEAESASDCW